MSISYRIVPGDGRVAAAGRRVSPMEFADQSPWRDIPLQRCILSLALHGALPPPVDWPALLPGSDDGVAAYRTFLALWREWVDGPQRAGEAAARYLTRPWERIVHAPSDEETAITAADVASTLHVFLTESARAGKGAYVCERAHAFGLVALCELVGPDATVLVKRTFTRPAEGAPIAYLTAPLEGYDRLRRAAAEDNGDAVWVEFLSGDRYRIPAAFLYRWRRRPIVDAAPPHAITAKVVSRRRSLGVRFASGEYDEFGAETILLNCEPRYRAHDERDGERQFMREGLTQYGYLGRRDWLAPN